MQETILDPYKVEDTTSEIIGDAKAILSITEMEDVYAQDYNLVHAVRILAEHIEATARELGRKANEAALAESRK